MKGKTALEIMNERYGNRPGFKEAVAREKKKSDQDPSVQFARLAKAIRKKLKISQQKLAKILEVSQPRISQIESGCAEGFQMESYIRLITSLGCTFRIHVDLPEEYVNENTDTAYDLAFPPRQSLHA